MGNAPNRSSEGVSAIRHPRTDFPQDGWISFVERTQTVPLEREGTEVLLDSFRMPERRPLQRNAVLYPDAFQQAVTAFVPVVALAVSRNDWHIDTFQTARGKRYQRDTNVDNAWIQSVAGTPAAFDPSGMDWHIDTGRMDQVDRHRGVYLSQRSSFAVLDARPLDPAFDQLRNSYRLRERNTRPLLTPDSYGWLATSIPTPFDPQNYVHVSDDRLRDRYKKVPRLDQPSQAWITVQVPAFDASLVLHGPESFRMRRNDHRWPSLDQPNQGWFFAPLPIAPLVIHGAESFSTKPGRRLALNFYRYVNDLSWVHDVIPLTDPAPVVPATMPVFAYGPAKEGCANVSGPAKEGCASVSAVAKEGCADVSEPAVQA